MGCIFLGGMEEVITPSRTEDSSRSALTFIPPVTREIVSFPDKSVTWTKVSLNLSQLISTTSPPHLI